MSSAAPNQPVGILLVLDSRIAKWLVALLTVVIIGLAFDRPPPDPDYYVYLDQAKDIASLSATDQKFPPGYPALLSPLVNLSPTIIEGSARAINILAFVAFGIALLRFCRKYALIGSCVLIAGVLGNRYTITTALNCTSHLPFVALFAWCAVCTLERRWGWAYLLAVLALSMRYNGVVLPVFVAISQILSHRKEHARLSFGRIISSLLIAGICLAPTFAWMKFGTEKGPGDYYKETQLRGAAGPKVAQYVVAGAAVSFTDEVASNKIIAGEKLPKLLFGFSALVLFGLALIGAIRAFKMDLVLGLWLVGSLLWWLVVHSRFAEVGGAYFYSVQTTWMVWLAVTFAISSWIESGNRLSQILLLTIAVAAIGGVYSGVALAAALLVWMMLLWKSRAGIASAVAISTALLILTIATAYQKIYLENYRPAGEQFLAWANEHPNVLVSPHMLDQWHGDGVDTSGLVSEELIDGTDLAASLTLRNVKFAAVTSREMDFRSEEEFLKGHEFFLGPRYKSSLRPYGLLFPIFKQETWKKIEEFRVRDSWVRVYERPDPSHAKN